MPEETGPSPIDLCAVADVLAWLGTNANPASAGDSDNIQGCITAWSMEMLRRTGLNPNRDGSVPDESPFVEVVSLTEIYDGSGGERQYLRVVPIQSVTSVQVNLTTVPQSTAIGVPGWVIDGNRRSIALRSGQGGNMPTPLTVGFYTIPRRGYVFVEGVQNVQVVYTAGFAETPEDVYQTALEVVAQNYKRKNWIDQRSQAMAGGAGTTSYRDWEMTPQNRRCVADYTRRAIVG